MNKLICNICICVWLNCTICCLIYFDQSLQNIIPIIRGLISLMVYNWGYMREWREKYMSSTQTFPPISKMFGLESHRSIWGARCYGVDGTLFSFLQGYPGVKKWSEAHLSEVIPFVVSYISPFVVSYNPNYTIRLISHRIIWILLTSFRTFSTSKLSGAADAILYCVEPIFNVFCDENGRELGLEIVVNRNR